MDSETAKSMTFKKKPYTYKRDQDNIYENGLLDFLENDTDPKKRAEFLKANISDNKQRNRFYLEPKREGRKKLFTRS